MGFSGNEFMTRKPEILTTTRGNPVGDNQNSLSAGPRGPVLMQDYQLLEKLAHQNRERIPERTVHAKGSGAYGTLTITHDITRFTKAGVFAGIGRQTEVLLRFSTVAGERGAADAERDVRGFALKFYTEEGNWDLVGNNTPVFFVRDPLKFPDFIHTQKRHPKTNLRSPTAMWDFWSQCHRSRCIRSRFSCSDLRAASSAVCAGTSTATAATPTVSSTRRTSGSG